MTKIYSSREKPKWKHNKNEKNSNRSKSRDCPRSRRSVRHKNRSRMNRKKKISTPRPSQKLLRPESIRKRQSKNEIQWRCVPPKPRLMNWWVNYRPYKCFRHKSTDHSITSYIWLTNLRLGGGTRCRNGHQPILISTKPYATTTSNWLSQTNLEKSQNKNVFVELMATRASTEMQEEFFTICGQKTACLAYKISRKSR